MPRSVDHGQSILFVSGPIELVAQAFDETGVASAKEAMFKGTSPGRPGEKLFRRSTVFQAHAIRQAFARREDAPL